MPVERTVRVRTGSNPDHSEPREVEEQMLWSFVRVATETIERDIQSERNKAVSIVQSNWATFQQRSMGFLSKGMKNKVFQVESQSRSPQTGRNFTTQWGCAGFKGIVTRFCACAASWFLIWRTFFQDWLLVKKSSSIDPETPEKAIISVFKSYLVHLGSLKRHILYFCANIVEKIRSHWGEVHEGILLVVSVPTNGSNVAFNVVIWLSFLAIKFSSQQSTFFG